MNHCSDNDDLKEALHTLADELSRLILREHQILSAEMKQLCMVVGDAVENIDHNFRALNAGSAEQTRLIDQVLSKHAINDELKQKLLYINEQIDSHTAKTIRALQFDDIVQQLAGHACDRLARMQELFNEIGLLMSSIKSQESYDPGVVVSLVASMQSEVDRFRIMLEKENPVKQDSLREGRIELF